MQEKIWFRGLPERGRTRRFPVEYDRRSPRWYPISPVLLEPIVRNRCAAVNIGEDFHPHVAQVRPLHSGLLRGIDRHAMSRRGRDPCVGRGHLLRLMSCRSLPLR